MSDVKNKVDPDGKIQYVLYLLSAATLCGAIARMFFFDMPIESRFDDTTLLYLAVSGALVLLRNVKTLAFGDFSVELGQVKEIATEARDLARIAEDSASYGLVRRSDGPGTVAFAAVRAAEPAGAEGAFLPGSVHDDPWKGVFGGMAAANNRVLSARVTELSGRKDWFRVALKVESAAPKQSPLKGNVQFFLHDTFANNRPRVEVSPDGTAELNLKAWGAFTVGAVLDEGKTLLELDLAELADAPKLFRER